MYNIYYKENGELKPLIINVSQRDIDTMREDLIGHDFVIVDAKTGRASTPLDLEAGVSPGALESASMLAVCGLAGLLILVAILIAL